MKSGERIRPDEEPLWRGVTMLRYEGGRWHRQSKGAQSIVSFKFDSRLKEGKLIRQKIKLEPIDSPTLFGIRPILDASSVYQQIQPAFSGNDGTLFRSERNLERRIRLRGCLRSQRPRCPAARDAPE